jgi:alanine-glyoxylate transaminase/serine-glyoxylate transaminase/serine-pyruvate transaminase
MVEDANFAAPGEKFAVFPAGFFAERIAEMARRHGAEVVRCERAWGEAFDDQEARDFIRREKPRVVAYVQAETSTGYISRARRSAKLPM